MTIANGHYPVEFSFNFCVQLDNPDLAGGDVLIDLSEDAFCRTGLDEAFAFFPKGNAPHFIEGKPVRRYRGINGRLSGEICGIGLW